jgi:hypothetical protein
MSRLAFELRFAVRNVFGNFVRSFVVFFTLTVISTLAVVGFCIDDSLQQIFTYAQTEQYLDIDLVMSYDANSTTRIMNRRTILRDYADRFDFVASFFNFYAVVESGDQTVYVDVMSSSVAEMERVIDADLPSLHARETIITESLAEEQGLRTGDTIDLYLGDTAYAFLVVGIVADRGLFKGDVIFADKADLLELVYGVSSLDNIGNTMYFSLAEGESADDAIAAISAEPEYSSFVWTKVVDEVAIARMARFNSSIFFGLGIMALVALALVLRSVFPILFRDLSAQFGVIRILGGSSRFAFRVWIMEFVIILAGAVPLGIGIAGVVFRVAESVVGVSTPVRLDPLLASMAILSVVLSIFLELSIRFFHLRRRSSVALGTDHRMEKVPVRIVPFVLAIILIVLGRILGTWTDPWGRLAEVAFVLVAAFTGCGLLLKTIAVIVGKVRATSAFGLFSVRHLASDRIVHNTLKVATMAIVVIAITVLLNNFIVLATDDFVGDVDTDFVLTNIYDYEPSLKEEIVSEYDAVSADEALLYTKVLLSTDEGEKRLRFVFSLEGEALERHFHFDIDSSALERFADSTTPAILLPVSLGKVYGLSEGDEVKLAISNELSETTFMVAGFIDTYFDSIAFTNLISLPAYADITPVNSLVLDTGGDDGIATSIVKAYSSRMYYLIDIDDTIQENVDMFRSVARYMTLIGWSVVFCFLIVMLDNALLVYDAMKSDYARLLTLGAGLKGLFGIFLRESAVLMVSAALVSTFVLAFFFPAMPELMLLFDNYKVIPFDAGLAGFAVGAGLLVFLLGYGSHFIRAMRMHVVDEIKRY